MDRESAIAFLLPAVSDAAGTWADFGAGRGTFTEALAAILGVDGRIVAVERDRRALASLERLRDRRVSGAAIEVAAGDFLKLDEIAELRDVVLDGALFANALHYVPEPERVLTSVAQLVRPGGRIVVIEYDRARSNRWVPYPLPVDRLRDVAMKAGLGAPHVVSRRPSAYQGAMYCAAAVHSA
ncbi:MAG: class I SAM-dependent methyltransferase [Longimicrobiales bacterium]